MPSIAQQDYLVIKGKAETDYRLIAGVAALIERKTLFDAIIVIETTGEHAFFAECRPLSILGGPEDGNLRVDIYYDGGNSVIEVPSFTQTQFEGLAAIQDAENYYGEIGIGVDTYASDPDLYLYEGEGGNFICSDGKFLKVSLTQIEGDEYKITAIEQTEKTAEDGYVNVSFEDAQKLIGLTVYYG